MWSPTTESTAIKNNNTATTTTATASDNNKCKEQQQQQHNDSSDDDCRCSGVSSAKDQQQQQLNNFETNSKTIASSSRSDSAAENIDYKQHSGGQYISEALDSGFISGPQTTNSSAFIEQDSKDSTQAAAEYNIKADQRKQQQEHTTVPDSGCIDEEFEDDDYAAASSTQQKSQSSAANTTANSSESPMILKQNVDAGVSEWFCKLSLQTDATAAPTTSAASQRTNAAQKPPQVAGLGMNNLDAASARRAAAVAAANASRTQQQQQQAAASSAQITASNAWEKFYQQNDDGDTPLHLAVIWGYVDVCAALLRMAPHPCLFNIQNDEAQTPLHLAARTSQPTIIRMLLLAGAEPTIRDRDGNTALHLACLTGEMQCVRTLLEKFTASEIVEAHRQFGHLSNDKSMSSLNYARLPSDLEIRNYDGERCVHLVARNGNIDILRLLVLHGADINAREGRSGLTPLHIAIECCNEKLANFLLDECEKLNVETATYAGLTAYQVACMLNKSQLQTMLENYGAEPLTPPDSDYDSSDIEDLDDSKFYDRFGDPGYFLGYNGGNPMTVV